MINHTASLPADLKENNTICNQLCETILFSLPLALPKVLREQAKYCVEEILTEKIRECVEEILTENIKENDEKERMEQRRQEGKTKEKGEVTKASR